MVVLYRVLVSEVNVASGGRFCPPHAIVSFERALSVPW